MKKQIQKIEFYLLKFLLKRYVDTHLDQWDKFTFSTKKTGKIYLFVGQGDPGLGGQWIDLD